MSEPEQPEDDFAALFEASIKARPLRTGETVTGTIVAIGPEVALVDVGAKGEASIAVDELCDEDGDVEVSVGDRLEATITSTAGGITLSRRLQRGAATRRQIEDAFRSGLPVEGKVESQVKGGYSVGVAKLRAFCPVSQIDTVRDTDPASHIGRVYTFRIIEFAEDGRKFVVSRRAVLEAEQQARAEEVRRALTEGAVVTGRVVSVRDFGAFVDLGSGVQGLLHVSEMGWSRVADPAQVVKPGDEISVQVLRLESKGGERRIALSLKALAGDPWATASERYPPGQLVRGQVTRIAPFGVFVELEPGVEALLPRSEAALASDADLRKAFPIGAAADVVVAEIDLAVRRLRVSVAAVQRAEEAADAREYAAREDTARPEGFGSLGDKLRGALGKRET